MKTHFKYYMFSAALACLLYCVSCAQTGVSVSIDNNRAVISKSSGGEFSSLTEGIEHCIASGTKRIELEGGEYEIEEPIVLVDGVVVTGAGVNDVSIVQSRNGLPAFDLMGISDVELANMNLRYTGSKVLKETRSYRGSSPEVAIAGIYHSGDRGVFRDLKVDGFVTGVRLSYWRGEQQQAYGVDNKVHDVDVRNVDFGVLANMQDGLHIKGLTGSYEYRPKSKDPPHLIYISGRKIPPTKNFIIEDCYAENSRGGHAFKIRNATAGEVRNMRSKDCEGILVLELVDNLVIEGLYAENDFTHNLGSVLISGQEIHHITLSDITIDCKNKNGKIIRLDGNDNVYDNITINDSGGPGSSKSKIIFLGERSSLTRVKYNNSHVQQGVSAVRMSGRNLTLEDLECDDCQHGVVIPEECQNCEITVDPDKVKGKGGNSGKPYVDKSKSTKINQTQTSGN